MGLKLKTYNLKLALNIRELLPRKLRYAVFTGFHLQGSHESLTYIQRVIKYHINPIHKCQKIQVLTIKSNEIITPQNMRQGFVGILYIPFFPWTANFGGIFCLVAFIF